MPARRPDISGIVRIEHMGPYEELCGQDLPAHMFQPKYESEHWKNAIIQPLHPLFTHRTAHHC